MSIQPNLQHRAAILLVVLQALLALLAQDCLAQGADKRFVRDNAPAGGKGSSWATAYNNIKTAVTAANSNQSIKKIWVAKGTYFPGTTRFTLKNNLALYGGFAGTETQLSQRNIALNETILTGQGTNAIINGGTTNETAIVDGFTIRDGFTTQENGGAVINGSSTFRNCRFIDNFTANSGGAWYGDTGTPRFIACEFIGNECGAGGAAIETVDGSFVVVGCRFSGNTAAFAVIYSAEGSVTVVDSLIAGNDAAGILAIQGPIVVRNSTIAANDSPIIGAVGLRTNGTSTIENSIIRQNSIVGNFNASYSCLPASAPGAGNTSADPRFVNPQAGNWRVASNSPTIDAGSVALLPTDAFDLDGDGDTAEKLPVDLQGGVRRSDEPAVVDTGVGPAPVVDMGAFEFVRDCNGNGIVDSADIANGTSADTDGNGIPDECEDCNDNKIPDGVEIANGTSADCQEDGIPDECQLGVGATVLSVVDDGASEGDVGNNALGNFIWLNAFQVEVGGEVLRSVDLAFGGGIPAGDPVTVHVWTDPTNDGDPTDAVRRISVTVNAVAPGTSQFTTVVCRTSCWARRAPGSSSVRRPSTRRSPRRATSRIHRRCAAGSPQRRRSRMPIPMISPRPASSVSSTVTACPETGWSAPEARATAIAMRTAFPTYATSRPGRFRIATQTGFPTDASCRRTTATRMARPTTATSRAARRPTASRTASPTAARSPTDRRPTPTRTACPTAARTAMATRSLIRSRSRTARRRTASPTAFPTSAS
ncbi:MAG: right-handed parallel beta-helix repeat-containing protein [bacterium]